MKPLEEATWYQALTLTERIPSLGTNRFDEKLAESRRQRWRSQTPFATDSYYHQRLAMDGMADPESFDCILGEPTEALKERSPVPPTWLKELEKAFARTEPPEIEVVPPAKLPPGKESRGFLYAIEPLLSQGIDRLKKEVKALRSGTEATGKIPFDPLTVVQEVCYRELPQQLLRMLSQTMALELNVARLQGLLSGDSPRERFLNFLERVYRREAMLSILEEYPVLARELVVAIDRWVNFSRELLQHLCADWDEICTTFSPEGDPGRLVEIEKAGDSHRGGRYVVIAKFSSGLQLVYKPKALAIDVHFQELLTWLNLQDVIPPLKTLKVIDRGTYGWCEFVRAGSCNSKAEVEGFYQRIGGYLALLYALEATDFHSENLIAAGDQPVLIDLEALFHPRRATTEKKASVFLARKQMADSVLRVGLLPRRTWANAESEGIDKSGIGAKPGQMSSRPIRAWEGVATDEMHVVRQRAQLLEDRNRPQLQEADVNVLDYAEEIVSGFAAVYQCLAERRSEFQEFLTRFAGDEVRVVLRPTRTYSLLLQESFHPDVLQNALDRDLLFDRLWIEVQYDEYLARFIPRERLSLWQGDIPMFTTRPNSRDILGSDNQLFTDGFDRSGMELVQSRLSQLDARDLARQIWFIRASLSTVAMAEEPARWKGYDLFAPQRSCDRSQLIAAASAIGDQLELLALRSEEEATWMGLTLAGGYHGTLAPLTWTLYDGLPGMALFLAYLGAIAGEERYTKLARSAMSALEPQIKEGEALIPTIGGFSGWGGVIYTLTHLSILWSQPELLAQAVQLVENVNRLIAKDACFDIIAGAAGCIASLLALYRCAPDEKVLATAMACGDHLLSQGKPQNEGICWVRNDGNFPTTGFAHGGAGIAWALLELAAVTNCDRFREGASAAIAYERSQLAGGENLTYPPIWCNGISGIGLGRLHSLKYMDDAQTRREINTAVNATLERGFGLNHCLCHGDLGNLELLRSAGEIIPFTENQIDRLTATIVESMNKHGWLCGTLLGVETPGLMIGLAGIGYGLLRLASPDRVPSVLLLAPPKCGQK
ncbi:MAG: type 2 lanthipeptide synthetase LanM family protein [Hormoscilla sp.]